METARRLLLAAVTAMGMLCASDYGADSTAAASVSARSAANACEADSAQSTLPSSPAQGGTGAKGTKPVRVEFAACGWLSGLPKTVKAGDRENSTGIGLKPLKALDSANFARLEVRRDRLGLFSDLDCVKLSGDTEFWSRRVGLFFGTEADDAIQETMTDPGVIRSFDGSRLDLYTVRDEKDDAGRKVVVARNVLLSDLSLVACANVDSGDNNRFQEFDFERARLEAGFDTDLGLDRKAERNACRASLIALDQVDAQSDLVSVRNDLTAALVAHTIARLQFWRDMGILFIKGNGQWEEVTDVKQPEPK